MKNALYAEIDRLKSINERLVIALRDLEAQTKVYAGSKNSIGNHVNHYWQVHQREAYRKAIAQARSAINGNINVK